MDKAVRSMALKLRLQGKSYNEIIKEVPVSKSTLSLWLRDVIISEEARRRLNARVYQGTLNGLIKRNKLQTHLAQERAKVFHAKGRSQVSKLNQRDLLLIGAVLYWAEGYKRPKVADGKEKVWHIISFVNADAEMVRVFMRFLRESMHIPDDRIRASMRLYPHINEGAAFKHWSRVIGLPRSNFYKTTNLISVASKGKRPTKRLPYGTLQISVSSTPDFHHIMGLIEGVKSQL